MISRSPLRRTWASGRFPEGSESSVQTSPQERPGARADLVRTRGGNISAPPRRLMSAPAAGMVEKGAGALRLTKVLVNVNIERSIGPVQVLISPEKTVGELIIAAMEIYVKEKRRPLLKHIDPSFFQLHYSQFSLESLKRDEKVIKLGSRNFFLYSKPFTTLSSCCSGKAKNKAPKFLFSFSNLMDFLL